MSRAPGVRLSAVPARRPDAAARPGTGGAVRREPEHRPRTAGGPRVRAPLWRSFRQGVVVNVLNPKTALFFLAFLPQFVDPERGLVALQVVVLGLSFVALGVVTDSTWALVAGATGDRLRRSSHFPRIERWFSGTVLVGLGVAAAASGSRQRS